MDDMSDDTLLLHLQLAAWTQEDNLARDLPPGCCGEGGWRCLWQTDAICYGRLSAGENGLSRLALLWQEVKRRGLQEEAERAVSAR